MCIESICMHYHTLTLPQKIGRCAKRSQECGARREAPQQGAAPSRVAQSQLLRLHAYGAAARHSSIDVLPDGESLTPSWASTLARDTRSSLTRYSPPRRDMIWYLRQYWSLSKAKAPSTVTMSAYSRSQTGSGNAHDAGEWQRCLRGIIPRPASSRFITRTCRTCSSW
jgi:hypothetical protein